MKKFAEDLSKRTGKPLPKDYAKNSESCRAFLDANTTKREDGAPPGSPSPAALAFASRLATENGQTIPESAKASGRELSAWIDKMKGAGSGKPQGGSAGAGRRG